MKEHFENWGEPSPNEMWDILDNTFPNGPKDAEYPGTVIRTIRNGKISQPAAEYLYMASRSFYALTMHKTREIIMQTIQDRSEIHFTEDELDEIYRYISRP